MTHYCCIDTCANFLPEPASTRPGSSSSASCPHPSFEPPLTSSMETQIIPSCTVCYRAKICLECLDSFLTKDEDYSEASE